MKIATWNVNEFVGITTNLDNQETTKTVNKTNIEEMINIINENDFDVICFQEFPVYVDGMEMISEQITRQTHLKYYCAYDTYDSFLFDGGRTGVAIFSKYEILDKELVLFGNPDMTKKSSSGLIYHSVDKGIIKATIIIQDKKYTIINGHAIAFAPYGKTAFDYPESYKPFEEMIYDCSDENLIAVGDLNTEKTFDVMPNLRKVVKDIVNGPTTNETYEKRGAIQRDYILINKNVQSISVFKLNNFSDHLAVYAEIN